MPPTIRAMATLRPTLAAACVAVLEVVAALEEGTKHPPSVERERGQQVEAHDDQVEPEQTHQDGASTEDFDGQQRRRSRAPRPDR